MTEGYSFSCIEQKICCIYIQFRFFKECGILYKESVTQHKECEILHKESDTAYKECRILYKESDTQHKKRVIFYKESDTQEVEPKTLKQDQHPLSNEPLYSQDDFSVLREKKLEI